jgi:hypothetical protein
VGLKGGESGGAGGGVTSSKQGHAALVLCRRRRHRGSIGGGLPCDFGLEEGGRKGVAEKRGFSPNLNLKEIGQKIKERGAKRSSYILKTWF